MNPQTEYEIDAAIAEEGLGVSPCPTCGSTETEELFYGNDGSILVCAECGSDEP